MKGRYYFAKRTRDDVQRGIDYFQQATILDPHFALAYARMAEAYNQLPSYPYRSPGESFPRAIAAAKRALEIDPALAEAHTALANSLAVYEWNWNEAEREFKRALDLDPNSAAAHFRYGQLYLTPMGRPDEAIAEVKRALELEPLDLTMGAVLSGVYVAARQYDQAVDQAQRTLDLEPTFPLGRWMLGQAYISKGMYGEASGLSDKSLQNDPTNQSMLRNAGYVFARTGRRAEAEDIIRRFKEIARTQYVMSSYVASIYAALGDKDKAFAELDKAAAEHDWNLHRLNVDPFIDPLRDDPRFAALVKKVGLERR